jgi:hypothetical protein
MIKKIRLVLASLIMSLGLINTFAIAAHATGMQRIAATNGTWFPLDACKEPFNGGGYGWLYKINFYITSNVSTSTHIDAATFPPSGNGATNNYQYSWTTYGSSVVAGSAISGPAIYSVMDDSSRIRFEYVDSQPNSLYWFYLSDIPSC